MKLSGAISTSPPAPALQVRRGPGACPGGHGDEPSGLLIQTPHAEPGPGADQHSSVGYRDHMNRLPWRAIGQWLGDIIGALALFVILFGGLFLAEVFK